VALCHNKVGDPRLKLKKFSQL